MVREFDWVVVHSLITLRLSFSSSNASGAEETGGHATGAATHAAAHTSHHHGVESAGELEELHLLLLHVHGDLGVLVDLVRE